MNDEFADIIAQLESKQSAIGRAIEALRGVESGSVGRRGRPAGTTNHATKKAAATKKSSGLSEAGRKSLAENMKRLWAIKRAAAKKAVKKAAKKKSV